MMRDVVSKLGRKSPHSVVRLWVLFLVGVLASACGNSSAGLSVGDRAPDFTLPTSAGGVASLSNYVGKQPVLLYFHMAMG